MILVDTRIVTKALNMVPTVSLTVTGSNDLVQMNESLIGMGVGTDHAMVRVESGTDRMEDRMSLTQKRTPQTDSATSPVEVEMEETEVVEVKGQIITMQMRGGTVEMERSMVVATDLVLEEEDAVE